MTTPGDGGDRLEVGVVADATGFAKDAQAKIDAATARIRAKIKADIDFRRLQAQAEAAAKRIAKQTQIRLQIGVDKKYLLASLDAAVAEANARNHAVHVKVDVDREQLDRALNEGGGTVTVRSQTVAAAGGGAASTTVTANTGPARAEVEAFQRDVESEPIDVPVQIDQQSIRNGGRGIRILTQNMTGLQKVGFYAGLIQTLTSAVTAAGGGLLAMAGAASQAVGVLAALPNAVGVAVQGLGALFAGFSGIGDAVGAMGQVQQAAGRSAAQSARQQEQAARQVAAAERAVTESQKASQRAQEALNRARVEAKEALEDYQLQLSGAALDEEGAVLAIERAREAWNKAMRNPASTALDRKEADLALRQAEQSLKEIQDRNGELREEAAAAEAAGIEGSAQVVGAKEDVADALQQELDAQENLADAISAASDQMAAQATAANNLAMAMAKLSPEGREFARFLNDVMKPRMLEFRNGVQSQLLPGVQAMLTALNRDPGDGLGSYLDVLQDGMEESGRIMGETARKAGDLLSSPLFRQDTATIMASNNRALEDFSGAGLALMDILRNLAVAAGPVLERFASFVRTWMEGKQAAAEAGRETGRLQAFMERAADRAAQLGRIVANLGRTLFGMGKAGVDVGDNLLDKFEALTKKWDTWANSDAGQARMQQFFANIQPLFESMGATIAKVTELFVTMGENGGGSVAGMLDAINLLLDGLTWLLQSPVGPFISTLMQFGGAASVIGLLGGKVFDAGSRMVTAASSAWDFARGLKGGADAAADIGSKAAGAGAKVRELASAAGSLVSTGWDKLKGAATTMVDLGKKTAVATAKVIAQTAAWTAQKIAMGLSAIATGVMTAAQWLLNVAMSANPIMLIVLAIGLLVAAFLWLWNNVEGFKEFWVGAFEWIQDAVSGVLDWIRRNWPLLLAILTGPIGLAVLWIVRHWDEIKAATERVFSWIGDFINGIWDGLGAGLKTAVNGIIRFLNSTVIAGINLSIRGVNLLNPFDDIPQIPKIPLLARGAIVRRPTLAMVGEDGDELVLPLSAKYADRRAELMEQAGLSAESAGGGDISGVGGWARLDALSDGRSLAELVSTSGGAIDQTTGGGNVGVLIQEGAVKQYITNPEPETASGTLNSGLRRVAATGIFGDGPGR